MVLLIIGSLDVGGAVLDPGGPAAEVRERVCERSRRGVGAEVIAGESGLSRAEIELMLKMQGR